MEREAVREFGRRAFNAALTALIGLAWIAYILYGHVPESDLLLWFGLNVTLCLLHAGLAHGLQRQTSAATRHALLTTVPCTLCVVGLSWGLTPVILTVPGDITYTLLCCGLLCSVTALSVYSLCLHQPSMWGFMVAILLPIAWIKYLTGSAMEVTLGLSTFGVLGLSLLYGTLAGRHARAGIHAMLQNSILASHVETNDADLRTALRAIREMSARDPLTQCHNRRAMTEHLEREMLAQDRTGRVVAVLLIDVDHFKRINDVYGLLTGDEVLRALTERIQSNLRGNDFLARYGGEEFVCVIHVDDPVKLANAAERIRADVAATPLVGKPETIAATVSVGATLRQTGEAARELFARADQALFRAKNAGRNCIALDLPEALVTIPADIDLSVV